MTLNNVLYNTGLIDMFDPNVSDFTRGFDTLNGLKKVFVSDIFQHATIRFDEKGSEASAVTSIIETTTVSIKENSTPVYYLEFNHPFLFMIFDTQENVPLFIGQVYDPEC